MRRRFGLPRFLLAAAVSASASMSVFAAQPAPPPPGRMVDLGGHSLHVLCTGSGAPTVVVENGLGDFSFDWALVQGPVSKFARICTYDRAGYAWSDPGPMPRSFAQLNLELRDALSRLGEKGPYVLVGHSFGGPVVRQFALSYPKDTAAVVLVDSASENQQVQIPSGFIWLYDGAKGVPIPAPRETLRPEERARAYPPPTGAPQALDDPLRRLPPREQQWQLWAQSLPAIDEAESSQREWSTEYFARWHARPQDGSLGSIPLIVLFRAVGGYDDDEGGRAHEKARYAAQTALARLSTKGTSRTVASGHQMHLEAPDEVVKAIREAWEMARAPR
jgi:pimeloyl-ACP methyl ester carboxylesterase